MVHFCLVETRKDRECAFRRILGGVPDRRPVTWTVKYWQADQIDCKEGSPRIRGADPSRCSGVWGTAVRARSDREETVLQGTITLQHGGDAGMNDAAVVDHVRAVGQAERHRRVLLD
jgi:hypothetical protein